ncbi:MAG: hypothetical protein GQ564_11000 [Bacteroidales bacterium]|nr:hypothetical protein [Bacteroidales bacterium]
MKRRFKFILSSIIIISLIGLGENIFISCPNVKYYKETEWLSTSNPKGQDSICFYNNQYIDVVTTNLNIKLWSNEYILYYNQKVNVKLISQTNMLFEITPINLIINKSYIPRKSIENHHIS